MWLASLLSPKKFFYVSEALFPWVSLIFLMSLTYGLIDGLFFVPADYLQGEGFRIIYVHAPCAFLSLGIYAIMSFAAFLHLVFRIKIASIILRQSASLGATFTFLALITGSLWGKPMWGTWWIWDARITSELILLFIYLGIILLQRSLIKNNHAHASMIAVLTLVGMVDLPIIHYSVSWWNTLHQGPTLKIFAPSLIHHRMLMPLIAMIVAFMAFYVLVLFLKLRYEFIVKMNHDWQEIR